LVDLRVDSHVAPIRELERIYGVHQFHFGRTPIEQWRALDCTLALEIEGRLALLGYADGDLETRFASWAGFQNLEERVDGIDRVDPVVLGELRSQTTEYTP
jgi:uncharacterized Ntn-hydrolase superfamily protein